MNKPAFSQPDRAPYAVTPGTTPDHQLWARRVRFIEPPDQTGPEWYDKHSEEL